MAMMAMMVTTSSLTRGIHARSHRQRRCTSSSASQPLGTGSTTTTVTEKKRPVKPIELVVTDVDGTLLNANQELDEAVVASVAKARAAGVPLMIATGKAVGPWTANILPALGSSCPEIFLQGLFIRDQEGNTLYADTLADDVLLHCVALAKKLSVSLVLYGSDRIICESRDEHTDRLIFYGEPTPEAVGDVAGYLGAPATTLQIHKVIHKVILYGGRCDDSEHGASGGGVGAVEVPGCADVGDRGDGRGSAARGEQGARREVGVGGGAQG